MRDPAALGKALLAARPGRFFKLSERADRDAKRLARVPDYLDGDPIAKYGRPQDRPEGV